MIDVSTPAKKNKSLEGAVLTLGDILQLYPGDSFEVDDDLLDAIKIAIQEIKIHNPEATRFV